MNLLGVLHLLCEARQQVQTGTISTGQVENGIGNPKGSGKHTVEQSDSNEVWSSIRQFWVLPDSLNCNNNIYHSYLLIG